MKKVIGGAIALAGVVAGSIIYVLTAGNQDVAELTKEGYVDCVQASLTCPVRMTDDVKKIMSVKGEFLDMKYLSVALPVMKCLNPLLDSGVVVVKAAGAFSDINQMTEKLGIFDVSLCKLTDCADAKVCASQDIETAAQPMADSCAWRPKGAVDCTRIDGSDPGDENTMQPGQYKGADCVVKNCFVVAGDK